MSTALVDTHAHLDSADFAADRDEMIERAFAADVRAIITIGVDVATSNRAIELAEKYPGVYAAAGIHPNDCASANEDQVNEIASLCQHDKVVAIGEIGLDFYRNYAPAAKQQQILELQMDVAEHHHLPVIIHVRQAEDAMMRVLRSRKAVRYRGVFHCFSGDARMASELLEMGFHLSFTGVITFKNNKSVEVLQTIPLNRLLTETDSPYMAPVPHRGKRNEPALVHLVAARIARAQRTTIEQVARVTTHNAEELFGIQVGNGKRIRAPVSS